MESMNILSSPYTSGGSGDGLYKSVNSTPTSRGGFTLLQGHIQLMAMVPHLPENQVSPRWKTSSDTSNNVSRSKSRDLFEAQKSSKYAYASEAFVGLPITPRMMPSASKFKSPNFRSVLTGKLPYRPTTSTFSRTVSNLSLPPKPAHPVTMPSFGRQLPGTKRVSGAQQLPSVFPPISQTTYPKVEPSPPDLPTSNPGNPGNFMNPAAWLPPQMAYQFMNQFIPPQQQQQPPQNFYNPVQNGGSGDHPPFPFILQQSPVPFQQNQSGPSTCYENPYAYQPSPRNMYFPHLQMQSPYPYSSPYSQSMPCFGTCPMQTPPNYSMQNFYRPPNTSNSTTLPPEPTGSSSRPSNSASMPDICFTPPAEHQQGSPQSCNSLPTLNTTSNENKEESILVEDSSSEEDFKSSCKTSQHRINLPPLSSKPKNISDIAPTSNEAKGPFGPDTNPTKIPCNPRVTHTPVGVIVNPRGEDPPPNKLSDIEEKPETETPDSKPATDSHSYCKCCTNTMSTSWEDDGHRREHIPIKFHTPRKKPKSVVVAVHDCFPSDSSVSDEENELMVSASRRPSNYTHPKKDPLHTNPPIPGNPVTKKRKPTLDNILYKPKLRGETEEVFDVLHDLSPDEVRLFTCDYLSELLSSEDWSNCHIGLQTMVRMARHRPKTLLCYLGPILWFAFKHLTSAKSALCRAAIVTFKELFQRIGSALDNDLEKLTEKLVIKSLAPNRFIREECYRALEAMVNHCTLIKVLTAMDIVSKKPHVRAATHRIARMTKQFVQVAGVDTCLKSVYAEKLLPMLFGFMTEANNETRVAAKEALAMLMNHLQFEKAVTKHVTFDRNCTEVFKKLDKMRGRNRYRGPIAATKAYNSLAQFRRSSPKAHYYH